MRAIIVPQWGSPPEFSSTQPPPEVSTSDTVTLKVLASGLHQLVRMQASGPHYTNKTTTMPYIPGADGVGVTPEGETVYFSNIAMGGGFAEQVTVPRSMTTRIPEGADPVVIAGLSNPAMSSWMSLAARVDPPLRAGFTVVITGATAISARVATTFCRARGAGTIVGVARNAKELDALADLGRRVVLAADPAKTDYAAAFAGLDAVDLVLDYLYGPAVVALLEQLPASPVPTQLVQIGTVASPDIALPGTLLRGKNIVIRGSGPGAWQPAHFARELPDMLAAVAKLPDMDLKVRKFEDVQAAWAAKKERTVFVP